ncbi:MAG: hypothetical protein NC342_08905 [Pseudoflavonifractor sp.]|nr:hypothetical protein [Alloprevotella sp.]MCM1117639.1 hypothetical protein [Pseudoflavonifractor sp.]
MARETDPPVTALSCGAIVDRLLSPLGVPLIPVMGALPDMVPDGAAIAYRRASMAVTYAKGEAAPLTRATVELWIYHPDYFAGLSLAEEARALIEQRSGKSSGLRLTGATLLDAAEDYAGDKYIQTLTFNLTIIPC